MAAAGDAPAGLFSGVWSRLHAAASFWRRPGQTSGGGEENDGEEEAAVRSRLVRRAAAARRLGRKLAFVSFNLEVRSCSLLAIGWSIHVGGLVCARD